VSPVQAAPLGSFSVNWVELPPLFSGCPAPGLPSLGVVTWAAPALVPAASNRSGARNDHALMMSMTADPIAANRAPKLARRNQTSG
jgi:hypothetical protein